MAHPSAPQHPPFLVAEFILALPGKTPIKSRSIRPTTVNGDPLTVAELLQTIPDALWLAQIARHYSLKAFVLCFGQDLATLVCYNGASVDNDIKELPRIAMVALLAPKDSSNSARTSEYGEMDGSEVLWEHIVCDNGRNSAFCHTDGNRRLPEGPHPNRVVQVQEDDQCVSMRRCHEIEEQLNEGKFKGIDRDSAAKLSQKRAAAEEPKSSKKKQKKVPGNEKQPSKPKEQAAKVPVQSSEAIESMEVSEEGEETKDNESTFFNPREFLLLKKAHDLIVLRDDKDMSTRDLKDNAQGYTKTTILKAAQFARAMDREIDEFQNPEKSSHKKSKGAAASKKKNEEPSTAPEKSTPKKSTGAAASKKTNDEPGTAPGKSTPKKAQGAAASKKKKIDKPSTATDKSTTPKEKKKKDEVPAESPQKGSNTTMQAKKKNKDKTSSAPETTKTKANTDTATPNHGKTKKSDDVSTASAVYAARTASDTTTPKSSKKMKNKATPDTAKAKTGDEAAKDTSPSSQSTPTSTPSKRRKKKKKRKASTKTETTTTSETKASNTTGEKTETSPTGKANNTAGEKTEASPTGEATESTPAKYSGSFFNPREFMLLVKAHDKIVVGNKDLSTMDLKANADVYGETVVKAANRYARAMDREIAEYHKDE